MGKHESPGKSNEWYTPEYIFKAFGCDFDLDVSAPVDRKFCHVPAKRFITENSLSEIWDGFVWMNAPFGNQKNKFLWLKKFIEHGEGIALTPDRTSAPWWQFALKNSDVILFVNGKIKFIKPNGDLGESPGNGTSFFGIGTKAVEALVNAEKNGLGIVLVKKP